MSAPERSPAVQVELEHRDGGPAMAVLLPYVSTRGVAPTFGRVRATPRDRTIWPDA
jgi:hypothetical protein